MEMLLLKTWWFRTLAESRTVISGYGSNVFQMDVCKQPVTDPSKVSKRGRLSLRRNSDGFMETVERGAGKPEEARLFL